jgi:hypothetical protein
MGTNYYRIPLESEMETRKEQLLERIKNLDMSPGTIERGFATEESTEYHWERLSPWDIFTYGTSIHLGKRSGGWKFCWNFHKNEYYSNKEELIRFVKSGRVVDEYGTEFEPEEFLKMAFEWCPDGHVYGEKYIIGEMKAGRMQQRPIFTAEYYDLEIDGLRVSTSTDFS